MSQKKIVLSRRQFLGGAVAAAGLLVVPRYVLGGQPAVAKAPSDRVAWALIGNGTRGGQQAGGNVALCDVDAGRGKYQDYRKMLDELDKSLDACLIATPDHTHAVIAMACIKRGKHVYVEKPLAHSIAEVRALGKAAKEHKVVSQLGNQGHSYETCAKFVEWVRDGAIGDVKEVHAVYDGCYSEVDHLDKLKEQHPTPANMNWDLYVGPAQMRSYNPMYHPHNWRHWSFFGTGCAGDWVCHTVDPSFWALELDYPTSIETKVAGFDPKTQSDTFAKGNCTKFEFAAKGKRGPVTLYWYEGGCRMPRPEGLEQGRNPPNVGAVVIGTKGGITHSSHGADAFRIYPESLQQEYQGHAAAKTIKRPGEQHKDWMDAIREGRPAACDFADFGGPLSEIALLTIIGSRFPGQKLLWDGPNAKFTNNEEANKLVNPPYREGWTL
jgi:predicted dehydrogenase